MTTASTDAVTQAVILVGGEGRRLRPLTDTRPKPMMPLVDRPFVAHQLDHLRRFGVHDVVFSCGYRPDALEEHFGDGSSLGMRIGYVVDPMPLGTAGAVRNAESLLHGGDVLVLNGDILTDLDLDAVVARHRSTGARGTIVLTPVEDPSAYGLVRLYGSGRVEAFLEKPRPDELRPGEPFLINAGTYILAEDVVRSIPGGEPCSIERDIFPVLAGEGALWGYPGDAYWRDIGTPASYLDAHADVLSGRLRTIASPGESYRGPGATVAGGARVGPLASIGARTSVATGAVVERSVVGDDSSIGPRARLEGAIVGAGVEVGEGAVVGPGVVVGDGARIGAGVTLSGDVRVPTGGEVVEDDAALAR